MTTSSNDELALKDLSYGFMNPIADGRTGNSTDRRRSDFNTWLRASIDEVYKTKALTGVDEFQGIVLQVSEKESTAAGDREAVLAQYAKRRLTRPSTWIRTPSSDELRPVCKVLIPELECRPVPYGFDDPVITTYYDTYLTTAADSWLNKPKLGSIVTVKFGNIANFSDPRITRIGKQIAFHGMNPTGNTDAGRNNPSRPAGAARSSGPLPGRGAAGSRNDGGDASSLRHRNQTRATLEEMQEEQTCYDRGDIPNKSQHASALAKMHPEFLPYAKVFICRLWEEKQISLRLNSSYRTIQRQQELYDAYVARNRTGPRPANPAAGLSHHVIGTAIDFNPTIPDIGLVKSSYTPTSIWHTSGIVSIGESIGLRWGGYFSNNWDPIHFDYGNYITNAQKKALYRTALATNTPANRVPIPA